MVVVMTQGDGGTSGLSPGWYFLWGGHLGGSPGLLLTLVTHMCPGWVAQGVLDGGAGRARWHFGVVVCLAALLWGGVSECHQGCHLSHMWVAQTMSQRHRAPWVLAVPRLRHHQHILLTLVPSLPGVTPAQAPHSHWGAAGSKWGGGSCSGVSRPGSCPQAVQGDGALTGGPSLTSRISSAPPARSVVGLGLALGGGTGHVPARCPRC